MKFLWMKSSSLIDLETIKGLIRRVLLENETGRTRPLVRASKQFHWPESFLESNLNVPATLARNAPLFGDRLFTTTLEHNASIARSYNLASSFYHCLDFFSLIQLNSLNSPLLELVFITNQLTICIIL